MFRLSGWNGEKLQREQLGKQSMRTRRNPELGYTQRQIRSPDGRKVCASQHLGWLAQVQHS